MNITEQLSELVDYYSATRQVGHTTSMLAGANNTPNSLILTHNAEFAKQISKLVKNPKNVTVKSINSSIRGYFSPLFIDNAALYGLFQDALNEINRLENPKVNVKSKIMTETRWKEIERVASQGDPLKDIGVDEEELIQYITELRKKLAHKKKKKR